MTADVPHRFNSEGAARAALFDWLKQPENRPGGTAGGYVASGFDGPGRAASWTVHVERGGLSWALRLWEISPVNPGI